MLVPTHDFVAWCLLLGALLYAGTWVAVVISRIRADREVAWADRIGVLAVEAAASASKHERLAGLIEDAPRRAVARALQDRLPGVALVAIASELIERIGTERLLRDAASKRRWRRIAALEIIALGRPAVVWDPLRSAVSAADDEVAAAAVTIAGRLHDRRAAEILISTLRSGRCLRSRIAAAVDLFPLNIADLIAPLLDDPEPAMRYWSAVLMQRYPRHAALAERLGTLADDPDPRVRKAAMDAALSLESTDARAVVEAGLRDPVHFVRGHAVRALAAMDGPTAACAIAPLLADPDWHVRFATKQCLVRIGRVPATNVVVTYLRHDDRFARNSAAEVLHDLGEFERLLLLEASTSSAPARLETLSALAAAGGAEMCDGVLARLPLDVRERGRMILERVALADGG
jgi:HEAT repeat protein